MRRARTNVSNDVHHIQSSLPPCICAVSFAPATVVKSRSPIRPSSSKKRSRFGSTAGSAPSARGSIDRSMVRYRPATSGFRPVSKSGRQKGQSGDGRKDDVDRQEGGHVRRLGDIGGTKLKAERRAARDGRKIKSGCIRHDVDDRQRRPRKCWQAESEPNFGPRQ